MRRQISTTLVALVAITPLGFALPPIAAAPPNTVISLRVKGCDGCVFVAHNGSKPSKAWNDVAVSDIVLNGKAMLIVPTRMTPTLTLEVKHPKGYTSGGATPFVAFQWLRYTNPYPGGPKRYGEICWGRKMGEEQTLNIAVTKAKARDYPGGPKVTIIRAHLQGLPKNAGAGINGTPSCN